MSKFSVEQGNHVRELYDEIAQLKKRLEDAQQAIYEKEVQRQFAIAAAEDWKSNYKSGKERLERIRQVHDFLRKRMEIIDADRCEQSRLGLALATLSHVEQRLKKELDE